MYGNILERPFEKIISHKTHYEQYWSIGLTNLYLIFKTLFYCQ